MRELWEPCSRLLPKKECAQVSSLQLVSLTQRQVRSARMLSIGKGRRRGGSGMRRRT